MGFKSFLKSRFSLGPGSKKSKSSSTPAESDLSRQDSKYGRAPRYQSESDAKKAERAIVREAEYQKAQQERRQQDAKYEKEQAATEKKRRLRIEESREVGRANRARDKQVRESDIDVNVLRKGSTRQQMNRATKSDSAIPVAQLSEANMIAYQRQFRGPNAAQTELGRGIGNMDRTLINGMSPEQVREQLLYGNFGRTDTRPIAMPVVYAMSPLQEQELREQLLYGVGRVRRPDTRPIAMPRRVPESESESESESEAESESESESEDQASRAASKAAEAEIREELTRKEEQRKREKAAKKEAEKSAAARKAAEKEAEEQERKIAEQEAIRQEQINTKTVLKRGLGDMQRTLYQGFGSQ